MQYVLILAAAYLLGSVNPAYFLSRARGLNLRTKGSGNLGASNATTILGWKVGALVAALDIAKGAVPVILARLLFPGQGAVWVAAGLCAVMGHIFPFYLGFKGGKGFASYLGMTLALNWKLAICVILMALVITVVTDYIALGTISTAVAVPAYLLYTQGNWVLALMFFVTSAVIIFKHRENITRILHHQEIGLRSTIRGENRVKS